MSAHFSRPAVAGFARDPARAGVAYALGAYLLWGFLPLYFKLLDGVEPGEIVAQRVLWSLLFLGAIVLAARRIDQIRAVLADRRTLAVLAASAALIGFNWLIYVWAVVNDHVLETSLGYYLNPLVNVAMGVTILRERLTGAQAMAVGLATAGVLALAIGAPTGLWISLALAFSFASYGLLRKIVAAGALEGLAVETLLLAPVALAAIVWFHQAGRLGFGSDMGLSLLLAFGGIATALPLLLFAAGARRLRYVTVGILQFIAPTIQFLLAVFAFGEPLTTAHLVCFAAIWTGLLLYAVDSLRAARRPAVAGLTE